VSNRNLADAGQANSTDVSFLENAGELATLSQQTVPAEAAESANIFVEGWFKSD
jgi:hypothetical protein